MKYVNHSNLILKYLLIVRFQNVIFNATHDKEALNPDMTRPVADRARPADMQEKCE